MAYASNCPKYPGVNFRRKEGQSPLLATRESDLATD